jgi:hypothetical protein
MAPRLLWQPGQSFYEGGPPRRTLLWVYSSYYSILFYIFIFRIKCLFFLGHRTTYFKASVVSCFTLWPFDSISVIFSLLSSPKNPFLVFSFLTSFFKKPPFNFSSSSAFSTSSEKYLSASLSCLQRFRSLSLVFRSSLTRLILSSFSFIVKRRQRDLGQVIRNMLDGTC